MRAVSATLARLLEQYRLAGEKPWIFTASGERRVNFVAEKYARRRCKILCTPPIPARPNRGENQGPPGVSPELDAKYRAALREVFGKKEGEAEHASPVGVAPGGVEGSAPLEIRELPPCITASGPALRATISAVTFSVLVMDMFHHGDPDEEITVSGFKTFEAAREYARRRTRDSVEENHQSSTSPGDPRKRWCMFGEDCMVLGAGEYSGCEELDFFIANSATPEDRDWASLGPKRVE